MGMENEGPLAKVTAREVVEWATTQPANVQVGRCGDPDHCLIAEYAMGALRVRVAVQPAMQDRDTPSYRYRDREYTLPDDLNNLALAFDLLAGDSDRKCPEDIEALSEYAVAP